MSCRQAPGRRLGSRQLPCTLSKLVMSRPDLQQQPASHPPMLMLVLVLVALARQAAAMPAVLMCAGSGNLLSKEHCSLKGRTAGTSLRSFAGLKLCTHG